MSLEDYFMTLDEQDVGLGAAPKAPPESITTDDLEDDWDTVRRTGASEPKPVKPAVEADLEGDWATLRNLPEFVYVAREDGDRFRVWRMRVYGQRQLRRHNKLCDTWIVSYEKLMFSYGEPPGPPDGRRYTIPKDQTSTDMGQIAAWVQTFRTKQIENAKFQIDVDRREIAEREHHVRILEDKIRRFSLPVAEWVAAGTAPDTEPTPPAPTDEPPADIDVVEILDRI